MQRAQQYRPLPHQQQQQQQQQQRQTPRAGDRTLRAITLVTFVPALAFLLPHGIVQRAPFPALGLLPQAASAIVAVVHLVGAGHLLRSPMIVDAGLAVFLVAMLIPGWVALAQNDCWGWCSGEYGMTMLGTYGTTALMLNFCIHVWFVIREIPVHRLLSSSRARTPMCPHCYADLRATGPLMRRSASSPSSAAAPSMHEGVAESHHSHESYHSLRHEEPRAMEEGMVGRVSPVANSEKTTRGPPPPHFHDHESVTEEQDGESVVPEYDDEAPLMMVDHTCEGFVVNPPVVEGSAKTLV